MSKILIDEATVTLALEALELVNLEFVCGNGSHYAKEDRHEWDEDCPITDCWRKALTALREALTAPTTTETNGGKTGWPPGLLQDDSKGLSKWLSNQPDAKRRVREALAEQPAQQEPVAWLHPANATCVTTDPSAYARGVPLYTTPQPAQPVKWSDHESDGMHHNIKENT